MQPNRATDRDFLMKRVGDLSQVAGLKRYRLAGGKADGVEAVDIRTGSGFSFTVLPGRCMDIAWAEYKGVALSYMGKPGITSGNSYEPEAFGWLRGFFAGLLTTCGLSNVGRPCEDEHRMFGKMQHGLHGRIAYTAADNVCVSDSWSPGYTMRVSGRMREAILHGENLVLEREIVTTLGRNGFTIRDVVENAGFLPEYFMILYHFNLGYPLLDADSRLLMPRGRTIRANDATRRDPQSHAVFTPPQHHYDERLFFHELAGRERVSIKLVNPRLDVGLAITYSLKDLPRLTEWKCMREAEYVVGIEPGNCHPTNRAEHRKSGELEQLAPGERRSITVDIDVVDGRGKPV